MGECRKLSMPEYVVAFAQKIHSEQGGPLVIRYDVTREDSNVGYMRTGDCGECLFFPDKNYYLAWVTQIHEHFTNQKMFVEWNVFNKDLSTKNFAELTKLSEVIEDSFKD